MGRTLKLALNFGESLREFWEILGNYGILDGRSVGSRGLIYKLSLLFDCFIMMAH